MDQNGPNMDHNEQTIIKNGPKMDKVPPKLTTNIKNGQKME